MKVPRRTILHGAAGTAGAALTWKVIGISVGRVYGVANHGEQHVFPCGN